jgi:hypothetical protein
MYAEVYPHNYCTYISSLLYYTIINNDINLNGGATMKKIRLLLSYDMLHDDGDITSSFEGVTWKNTYEIKQKDSVSIIPLKVFQFIEKYKLTIYDIRFDNTFIGISFVGGDTDKVIKIMEKLSIE